MTETAVVRARGFRDLGSLLDPASVVVVGASERHPAIVETACAAPAETWLINPSRDEVLGRRCYRDISELPVVPDAALVVVGHRVAEQTVRDLLAAGVKALILPGLGAEAGAEGREIGHRIAALADHADAAVLGANCMGLVQPERISLWVGTPPPAVIAGRVSVVAQSGSIAEALLAGGPRIGFRTVVSSGSELNRDAADWLAAFAEDEGTHAIGLFLETVRRPDAFRAALEACARAAKPVVCLKVGRSAVAAAVALTHTGAMVGSDRAFSALLAGYGVIEVTDVPDLVETLEVLGRRRRPRGPRLAAVSESGGEAALLADQAEAGGLVLEPIPEAVVADLREEFPNFTEPANPLDVWAVDSVDRIFTGAFTRLRDAGSYDILAAIVELTQFRSSRDIAWCRTVVEDLGRATRGDSIFPVVISTGCVDPPPEIAKLASEADIALLRGTRAAVGALSAVAAWRPRRPPPETIEQTIAVGDLLRDGFLPEFESATLLERYGVKFASFRRARSAPEAAAAATELGFPVVVKVDNRAHKAQAGGVELDVVDAAQAAAAAARLGGQVLVARQLPPAQEFIIGLLRDPTCGPVVSIGRGGSDTEALGASAVAIAPLDRDGVEELLRSVSGPPPGTQGHADLIVALRALSRLAAEHPQIASVDINPIIATAESAVAVDALVVTTERTISAR
ncbi:MAG TPA: acetate--CoA ligase family protein [Solirubrobacteraceae bacterium]|jgi:acetyltransferase